MGTKRSEKEAGTRAGSERREEACAMPHFGRSRKKLCINTTLSMNDKTVYKHGFFHVAQHRPKTKPCINTVFFVGRRRATRQKQCLYTLFSLRSKVVFIHCFFGSARNATLLKLAGALPHVLPPVPTCDRGGGIVCADRRRMWHDMAAKTQI